MDWLVPAAIALILTAGFCWARGTVNFFGAGGVISLILGFVQNLPGFYIAALAAIATFGRTDIDELMPGSPPPSIETVTVNGVTNMVRLTRRRFLCLLFAFLTVECVALTLSSVALVAFAPGAAQLLSSHPLVHGIVFASVVFAYFLFLAQLLLATLWGLYYLGERIHLVD
uniref:hypothetical protein n=1 Tax=Cupriavidus taiwanensis TaxID=164546 RepID=UPI0011C02A1F|nr:hypothetical protein [Cupriavidus taiwanensis]